MNAAVEAFVRSSLPADRVAGRDVLETGSMDVNGSVRPILMAHGPRSYVGTDLLAGRGVDVVCPVGELVARFGCGSFDVVVSTEMLEHVEDWRAAVRNMKRVLRTGGFLALTTRSPGFKYHPYPKDCWRFTQADLRRIFSDMTIEAVQEDPLAPGVFMLARMPEAFEEIFLSTIDVQSAPKARPS
jgi:SAM-dependent methyltransferase